MERKYQILIVDDDNHIRITIQNHFTQQGFEVETAKDGLEGIEKLRHNTFDIAIVEISLPKINGLEISHLVNQEGIDTDMIILTKQGKKEDVIAAINVGVKAWFEKSAINMTQLVKKVKELAEGVPLEEVRKILSTVPKLNFKEG